MVICGGADASFDSLTFFWLWYIMVNMENVIYIDPDTHIKEYFVRKMLNAGVVAFDIESSGLDPYTNILLMMQFGLPSGEIMVLTEGIPISLVRALGDVVVIGHNLSFDIKFMTHHIQGIKFSRVWDTMIVESCIHLGKNIRVGLGSVARRRLGKDLDKSVRTNFIGRTVKNFSEEEIRYAATDVAILFDIKEQQEQEVAQLGLGKVVELENNTVLTTAEMELRGMEFDSVLWSSLIDRYQEELLEVVKDIYQKYPNKKPIHFGLFTTTQNIIQSYIDALNLNSSQQNLSDLRKMGYPFENTSSFYLKQVRHKLWFAEALLKFRELNKMVGTYLLPLPEEVNPVTGRIHFDYRQLSTWDRQGRAGTVTGRYSCKRFQQIPADRELRSAFPAPDGWLTATIDYSNVELRIAGNQSGDKAVIDFFNGNVESVKVFKATVRGEGSDHITDVKYFRTPRETNDFIDSVDGLDVEVETIQAPITDYHGYMLHKTMGIPLQEAVNIVIDGVELPTLHPKERAKQKNINFASIYLVTYIGLARQLNSSAPETLREVLRGRDVKTAPIDELAKRATRDQLQEAQYLEADRLLTDYNKAVPDLMKTLRGYGQDAIRNFKIEDHSLGRIRWFEPDVPDWKREKAGANMPIQGTSANQMKLALNRIREQVPEVQIVGTVHDEVILWVKEDEVDEHIPKVKQIMIDAATEVLPGPIEYTVGVSVEKSWTK